MNKEQHGFFSLSETLRSYKRPVTVSEILKRAAEEGWSDKLLRLGHNSIIRQVNRHNEKYAGRQFDYKET